MLPRLSLRTVAKENHHTMTCNPTHNDPAERIICHRSRAHAFTLIELLTVIFIISLLIAILIPSLTGARNAAKTTATRAIFNALKTGLEMFKTDNERGFRQTNGYPPSFVHPPIPGYAGDAELYLGQFPFLVERPVVYGAMWLPAMLIGYDSLGFVKRTAVPSSIRDQPRLWYTGDPLKNGSGGLERAALYLDPGSMRMTRLENLPGNPNLVFFPDWSVNPETPGVETFPVLVDSFDQPILYYAASTYGKLTNMLEDDHLARGQPYAGGSPQTTGVPYYFHQDNEGFTGISSDPTNTAELGWDFGGGAHAIGTSGADDVDAAQIMDVGNRETFARYILDLNYYKSLLSRGVPLAADPLRSVNPDSYLLISAGVDGLYGTTDDVTNFPRLSE